MEVLVFSKKDCAPCEKLKGMIPDFIEEYPIITWTIIDYDENPELVKQFNITKTPTSVIIKNKTIVSAVVGLDYNKILSTLKFISNFTTTNDF
jgi:thiol-disulfide isomerase/thioredoxin